MDDRELLEHFYADGDNRWLGELLNRYTLLLMGVCMKYLKEEEAAKDAVQQVFIKVLGELPKYRVDFFKSWIYTIARNHCLMQLRSPSVHTAAMDERITAARNDEAEKAGHEEREQSLLALELALEQLGEQQRVCIRLFYLNKKSYREIAGITGYGLNEVKSHIQNGKRNLRAIIERKKANEE